MSIWGMLAFDDAVEVWYGNNDTHQVIVSRDAMLAAYQLIATRGIAAPTVRSLLKNLDVWLEDTTLATLEGVEIRHLKCHHH